MQHKTVKVAYISAVVWIIIGILLGIWEAFVFAYPEIMYQIPLSLRGFVEFGKLRQVHVNILAFAWLSIGFLGSLFYIIPKASDRELYSENLGIAAIVLWDLGLLVGVIGLLFGYSRGREYASMIWPSDLLLIASFILININIWKTIAKRTHERMNVSVWYLAGSVLWMPLILILGKGLWSNFFTNPFSGVFDNVANWFLGHNILGLWFTTLGVGTAYYIIPRIAKRPIFNHYLSVIGFWTLVLFYPAVGSHHTLSGPLPHWLTAEATVFSILMIIPVATAIYNIYKTVGMKWPQLMSNTAFAFIFLGLFIYTFVSFQGSFQALMFVSKYLHFSQWVPGHAMLALGGGFTFINFGAIYYILPRIIHRDWWSYRLGRWHLWLSFFGIISIFLALTIAGLIQGSNWANSIAGIHWVDATVRAVMPEMYFLVIAGLIFISGQLVFLTNFLMTLTLGHQIEVHSHAQLPEAEAEAVEVVI